MPQGSDEVKIKKPVDEDAQVVHDDKVTINERRAPMLKQFPKKRRDPKVLVLSIAVVLAGIGTGWALSGGTSADVINGLNGRKVAPGAQVSQTEAGVEDEDVFGDSAEGILESGGIDGEGTHHLIREGGPQKYVYLTSTIIDLEGFTGKTVQVWGETIAAQSAPWLMDVGKIRVIK